MSTPNQITNPLASTVTSFDAHFVVGLFWIAIV